jgi:hypothetical protein
MGVRIKYPHCVLPVALAVQHAERMRRIIASSVACLALPYFSTLSYKQHLRKSFLTYSVCFDLLYNFCLKHLMLRRIEGDT